MNFYVNGAPVGIRNGYVSLPRGPSGMMIGGYGPGGPTVRDFNGQIANVAYYATPLTPGQVAAHYQAAEGSNASEAAYTEAVQNDGPAAFYPLDGSPPRPDRWFVDSTTRPFTDLTTDAIGNVNGALVAQGNGLQAGVGAAGELRCRVHGELRVAQAGDVTFRIDSRDGFLLGVGGGASRVNGDYENAPGVKPVGLRGLPLVGAYNQEASEALADAPGDGALPGGGHLPVRA